MFPPRPSLVNRVLDFFDVMLTRARFSVQFLIGKATVVERKIVKSDRPKLEDAKRVVSGGRSLKTAAEFDKLIGGLADTIGAAGMIKWFLCLTHRARFLSVSS